VLGGAIFAVLPEALRFLGELNFAAFAVLLLIAVRVLPGGIVGWLQSNSAFGRFGRRNRRAEPLPEPTAVSLRRAGVGIALRLRDVGRRFKGLRAVDGVSFDVRAGEIVGLIGPNGAGKTTLLTLMSGFLPPSEGAIEVLGRNIGGLAAHEVAQRGVVRTFQQTAVFAAQTVETNMRIAAHLHRPRSFFASLFETGAYRRRERERLAHALGCLHEVGMAGRLDDLAGSLPYGEQKLLGVAMALAAQPSVLLLDEPAAGLNQVEANRLAGVLRDLRTKGLTMVVVDHNLKMLMSIADRVVVLHHGVKIADGVPQEVCNRPDVVKAYLGAPDAAAPRSIASNEAVEAVA
jgi:branched-chain amino acid transport system permease protein